MFRLQKKQTLARAPKWKPAGWHMGARWMAYESPLDGTWEPDGWHMGAGWMAHGNPLDGIGEPVGRLLQATMDNRKKFL